MYKKVKRNQVPIRERKSESRFESAPEWKALKADLDRGLKKDESCILQFAPADWERLGLSGAAPEGRNVASGTKAVRRFIQKYLDEKGLQYTVRGIHRDGFDYIIVDGPE
jgi:hypothetical protein